VHVSHVVGIGSSGSHPMDRHLKLVHDTFEINYDTMQVCILASVCCWHLFACVFCCGFWQQLQAHCWAQCAL
jgi:hypothetical protein